MNDHFALEPDVRAWSNFDPYVGGVNGGRNPGHWGGAKAGQFELGGGRSRSALFDSAVASERPVGFGRVVEAQTIPGSTAGA